MKDVAERMLLGGCSEGPIEPGINAEDFSQHLGIDAVMALRPLAGRKERHVVEAIARERDAHMSNALGVAAQLESQAVRAADEARRTARDYEALATKLGNDRLGYSQVSHGSAPSPIGPPRMSRNQLLAFKT
jgi:hypothetical protein